MNNSLANGKQVQEGKPNRVLEISLRTIVSFIGVCFIAIGAGFLKESNLGLDPFTAVNIGLSKIFGMSLGTVQLSFNVIIFIIVLIMNRNQIGIGTIFNMALVGYGIEWFTEFYDSHTAESLHIPLMVCDVILGIAFFTLGTSLYMEANLGVAPYDAIAPIIVQKMKLKYQWVRAIQDILFMIVGFLIGGAVGIMTLLIAFCAGPAINFWNVKVSQKIINSIKHFSGSKKKIHNVGTGIALAGHNSLQLVRNIYRQTNFMQRNMSIYTNHQLSSVFTQTTDQIRSSEMTIRNLRNRRRMIREEMIKRDVTRRLGRK